MTNQTDFGAPFVPQPPSQADKSHTDADSTQPAPRRQRGGRRRVAAKPAPKPRAKAPAAAKPAAKRQAPAKAAPAPRTARSGAGLRNNRATRIDLGLAVTAFAGLNEEAAKMVAQMAQTVDTLPKKMRGAVVQALGKLFP